MRRPIDDDTTAAGPALYSRRQFVAGLGGGAVAALVLSGCGSSGGTEAAGAGEPAPARSAGKQKAGGSTRVLQGGTGSTRVVQHALGEVEIPIRPKRLVTFEGTLNLVALGVIPIGARNMVQDEANHPEMRRQLTDIFDLGGQELDIEEVLALEPDLIIGTSPNRDDIYAQLSQIAPTVLYQDDALDRKHRWDEELLYFADVLGKEKEASELLVAYEARCAEFRSRMGERLETELVSVLRVSSSSTKIYTRGSFAGGVLQDAGLRRPAKQDLDAFQTNELTDGADREGYDISAERLREADGDVLFLSVRGTPSKRAPQEDQDKAAATEVAAGKLTDHPLWSRLGAVEAGQAFKVGGHWNGETVVDANKVLDDLFVHMLGVDLG